MSQQLKAKSASLDSYINLNELKETVHPSLFSKSVVKSGIIENAILDITRDSGSLSYTTVRHLLKLINERTVCAVEICDLEELLDAVKWWD
jgi:hypothetical protein